MNIEELREACLSLPGTEEGFPFGETTLVFKVMGKMFALASLDTPELRFNLKCDPELAMELRETYPCVLPGYHMSKIHWNTIVVDGCASREEMLRWIRHSYDLVVLSLPKTTRETLLS